MKNNSLLIFVFSVIFFLNSQSIYCQRQCIPYNTTETNFDSICKDILTSQNAYVFDEVELGGQFYNTSLSVTLFQTFLAPGECLNAALFYSCVRSFSDITPKNLPLQPGVQQCIEVDSIDFPGTKISIEQKWPVCKDFCDYYYNACYDTYAGAEGTDDLPDCSLATNDPIEVIHPETGEIVFVPCLNYSGNVPNITFECPDDDRFKADGDYCPLACPSPVLTQDEEDQLWLLHAITGWFSFVFVIFLIITYLLHSTKRLFPHRMIICILFSTGMIALGFILPSLAGSFERVWCGDEETMPSLVGGLINESLCIFQGILIMYGSLASCMWWMIIGLNTAYLVIQPQLKISTNRKKCITLREIVYHLFGWLVPLILVAVAGGESNIGYTNFATYCFVDQEDPEENGYVLGTWIIPISIMLFIGTIAFLVVLGRVAWVRSRVSSTNLPKRTILRLSRIILFLFFFLYFYIFVFVQKSIVESEEEDYPDSVLEWARCSLAGIESRDTCDKILEDIRNWDLQLVSDFNLVCQGFFVAIIFMIGFDVFTFWKNIIMCREDKNKGSSTGSARTTGSTNENGSGRANFSRTTTTTDI